jgi:hypothetical protein
MLEKIYNYIKNTKWFLRTGKNFLQNFFTFLNRNKKLIIFDYLDRYKYLLRFFKI